MRCPHCSTNLAQDVSFCYTCGKLMRAPHGETEISEHAETLRSTPLPSDPYFPQPPNYDGARIGVADKQNLYAPPIPPPHRRSSAGFLKNLFIGIVVILLLSGGLAGFLLLKQRALSPSVSHSVRPSVSHSVRPTATPQPIIRNTTPTANTISQFLPGTWTLCALETATCSFGGTMTVAFGANGSFNYATRSNGTACTHEIFGDPLYGTHKACYIEATPLTTNVWARCAAETATCSFIGTMTVAFGANGSFNYVTRSNGTACTHEIFGDPLYGTHKACYLISPPTSAATWNSCATENSTCSFTGKHEVAYGANGKYFYGSFTSGTACTDSIFGNPASGVAKTCYYQ
ncbi:MAG TPA: hypothetical protein VL485_20850 [Ktedonobacteraceae bacterium]|nr:hypothetical protein [Ktedonobacteraceae bacterium]